MQLSQLTIVCHMLYRVRCLAFIQSVTAVSFFKLTNHTVIIKAVSCAIVIIIIELISEKQLIIQIYLKGHVSVFVSDSCKLQLTFCASLCR